jgi:hypothetical protein
MSSTPPAATTLEHLSKKRPDFAPPAPGSDELTPFQEGLSKTIDLTHAATDAQKGLGQAIEESAGVGFGAFTDTALAAFEAVGAGQQKLGRTFGQRFAPALRKLRGTSHSSISRKHWRRKVWDFSDTSARLLQRRFWPRPPACSRDWVVAAEAVGAAPFIPRFALLEKGAVDVGEARALFRDFVELLFPNTPARVDDRFFGLVRRMIPGGSPATVFCDELPDAVQAAALLQLQHRFLRAERGL